VSQIREMTAADVKIHIKPKGLTPMRDSRSLPAASEPVATPRVRTMPAPARRWLRLVLPGVLLGAGVWLVPGESAAAPRCTSKPMVCARLSAQQKNRAPAPAPALVARAADTARADALTRPTVARAERPRCTTKPAVCARLGATGTRAGSPPVTLAQSDAAGARCTTKPAVCARLRVRPNTPPITLAADELR
jgi:hypothetical protein